MNVSDGEKLQRLAPSSNYPISPKSKAIRVERVVKEKKNLSVKVSALAAYVFNVDDEAQHDELLTLVRSVTHGSKAIEELCGRGDKLLGEGRNLLREAWRQDVIERLEYERDQSKSGMHY